MHLELVLSPALYPLRDTRSPHSTVAVDVLRATTSICAAFQAGAAKVVPLNSLEALPDFYARGYTLAAERDGRKVPHAQCGNSPTEYLSMNLQGLRLAYSTTNGTVSILSATDSHRLFVGAFANLSALAQRLLLEDNDVVVLCSGWKGVPCIEDTLFAGALAEKMSTLRGDISLLNDPAMMALDLWKVAKDDLYSYCAKATHVHRLQRLRYDHDIRFSLQLDTCPVVPLFDPLTASLHV